VDLTRCVSVGRGRCKEGIEIVSQCEGDERREEDDDKGEWIRK
jgi:hypothetical protein